jgi:hypothetical protein
MKTFAEQRGGEGREDLRGPYRARLLARPSPLALCI